VVATNATGIFGPAVQDRGRLEALRRSGLLRGDTFHRLDRLTRLAASLTGAPVSLISMVDEDRQYFTSQHGLHEPWASDRQTPLSHSVCQTVVASEDPVVIDDMGEDPGWVDHPARHDIGVEAYCGVPIRDPDGHVLGSFCVIDSERRVWDVRTVDILEQLAALVTETVGANRNYSTMVHDLQRRLIPDELPVHPGGRLQGKYRPVIDTDDVGGDFYDAFLRADGQMDVVVGDVVGHGVTSTHAAAQLRAAARAVFAGQAPTPADTINRIETACADLPGCEGAALVVMRISADGRTVRWARAGAMPPVVTGPNPRVLMQGASPPLGVGPCVYDPSCEVRLEDGEGLLLFTDGLVERRDEDLDAGFLRLMTCCREGAALAPDCDVYSLAQKVCPHTRQSDDLALVHWAPNAG
jgi:hypothetical protein